MLPLLVSSTCGTESMPSVSLAAPVRCRIIRTVSAFQRIWFRTQLQALLVRVCIAPYLDMLRLTDRAKADSPTQLASANMMKDNPSCRRTVNDLSKPGELPLNQGGRAKEAPENQAAEVTADCTNSGYVRRMSEAKQEQRPSGATNIDDQNAHLRIPEVYSINDNIMLDTNNSKNFRDYLRDISPSLY